MNPIHPHMFVLCSGHDAPAVMPFANHGSGYTGMMKGTPSIALGICMIAGGALWLGASGFILFMLTMAAAAMSNAPIQDVLPWLFVIVYGVSIILIVGGAWLWFVAMLASRRRRLVQIEK